MSFVEILFNPPSILEAHCPESGLCWSTCVEAVGVPTSRHCTMPLRYCSPYSLWTIIFGILRTGWNGKSVFRSDSALRTAG